MATDGPGAAGRALIDAAVRRAELAEDELERARAEIAGLRESLTTCRCIGMAVGIVMEREHVTSSDAFAELRSISARTHRKIRDIAEDLVFSGEIPAPRSVHRVRPTTSQSHA